MHGIWQNVSLEELFDYMIGVSACPQDQTPTNESYCSEVKKNMEETIIIPERFWTKFNNRFQQLAL